MTGGAKKANTLLVARLAVSRMLLWIGAISGVGISAGLRIGEGISKGTTQNPKFDFLRLGSIQALLQRLSPGCFSLKFHVIWHRRCRILPARPGTLP